MTTDAKSLAVKNRMTKFWYPIVHVCRVNPYDDAYLAGFKDALECEEVKVMRDAARDVSTQRYGIKNQWAGSWTECVECGKYFAFGWNWNSLPPDGPCPSCRLEAALQAFDKLAKGEM